MPKQTTWPHFAQLEANKIKTVECNRDYGTIALMIVEGDAPIYARVDGQDPAINADGSYFIPIGTRSELKITTQGNSILKMISAEPAIVELEV